MRRLALSCWTAVALGALLPAQAAALDYGGRLGLGYDRIDSWQAEGLRNSTPKLSLDVGASAAGYFVDPAITDWSLGGAYNTYQTRYGPSSTDRYGVLTYNGRLGLLEGRGTAAHLVLQAERGHSEYALDTNANRSTGVTDSDSYVIDGGMSVPGLPVVNAGYGYSHATSWGLGLAETELTRRTATVGTHFGVAGVDTAADYRADWDQGTLVPVNFMSQMVNLTTNAKASDTVSTNLYAAYFTRTPSTITAGNPRYETSLFDAMLGNQEYVDLNSRIWGTYAYSHNLVGDPGLPERESLSHMLRLYARQKASKEWQVEEYVSASTGQSRNGGIQTLGAGQSVGTTAYWDRGPLGVSFGGSLGALEPEAGPTELAYSATASGHAGWVRGARSFGVLYSVDYAANTNATQGWIVRQNANADLADNLGLYFRYTLRLQGAASRTGGGIYGGNAQRALGLTATAQYRSVGLFGTLGFTDAVAGALGNPLTDGLFLPAGYNQHTFYTSLGVAATLLDGLAATADTMYTMTYGPAAPEQREMLVRGSLRYVVGRWTFSFEDSYTIAGTSALDNRVNVVYLRANRVFGGHD